MTQPTSDRDRLVGAARALLMEDGYDSVTAAAAAVRAKVSAAAAQTLFPTKDDLVLAALDAHWADLKRYLEEAFVPTLPPLDRLRRFFDGIYAFQDAQWSQLGCVVGCLLLRVGSATSRMGEKPRKRVAERLNELHVYIESALKDAQEQGLIRAGDIPTMGWTLIHYVEGVLGMARIQNDLHTLQGMMEHSLEFLGAKPAPLTS
jgi:TetR/AcrR family transcriptional repressor of nem operon